MTVLSARIFRCACSLVLFSIILLPAPLRAQMRPYESTAGQIFTTALRSDSAYTFLKELCLGVGARITGSPRAALAVEWGKRTMESLGFRNVHLEPVTVPQWVRGPVESAVLHTSSGNSIPVTVCALGGSIATPPDGITAEVVEVKSFDELHKLGGAAKGKFVFFNRPMDPTKIQTFEAYGGAVDQRGRGAIESALAGGVGAIVRSMTMRPDDVPHTGAMGYIDSIPKVPSAAISLVGATTLDSLLQADPHCTITLKLSAETRNDVESANVVGELTGTEKPEEVIVIGGHLDSWDKGQGAHDDGAGIAHTLETLRLLKAMGLQPKRTIRAVMFMNEEHGLNGGKAFAAKERPGEKIIAAIETDAGGFVPRGFGVSADSATVARCARWAYLFQPIDADHIRSGGGGADISELGKKGIPTIGLRVESQRYFDFHHSDNDVLDAVNPRELELGAAVLSIFTYVIAQEGL
jgi:carboxypeptidase Q